MLRHPCILGDPQRQARGTKSEVVTSHLPSRGPKRGWSCCVTPAFSGILKRGEQNQKWLPHLCLLKAPKRAEVLCHPGILRGPEKRRRKSPLAASTLPSQGPKGCKNDISSLYSRGSPTPSAGSKIRSGPQQRGTKSEVAVSPSPSRGPQKGRKCYVTPAFSGIPRRGEQNQNWLPHPFLLRGPKEGRNAMPRLHSRGPKQGRNATSALLSRGSLKEGNKNLVALENF